MVLNFNYFNKTKPEVQKTAEAELKEKQNKQSPLLAENSQLQQSGSTIGWTLRVIPYMNQDRRDHAELKESQNKALTAENSQLQSNYMQKIATVIRPTISWTFGVLTFINRDRSIELFNNYKQYLVSLKDSPQCNYCVEQFSIMFRPCRTLAVLGYLPLFGNVTNFGCAVHSYMHGEIWNGHIKMAETIVGTYLDVVSGGLLCDGVGGISVLVGMRVGTFQYVHHIMNPNFNKYDN